MKRETEAGKILDRLLDRYERRKAERRIIERPAQAFAEPNRLRALVEHLSDAAASGAVELKWDRDAPHLIEQVILIDPDRLYDLTGRRRPEALADEAATELDRLEIGEELARGLREDFKLAWSRRARFLGLGVGDRAEAASLILALEAAFTELEGIVPLRTRSARLLGDSKTLERALPALLAYLRHIGIIAEGVSRETALEELGLAKFGQPVLVAGPIRVEGSDLSDWPYAGVPPELAGQVEPTVSMRSLLTIENLESFNRHVRECRGDEDVVVYTGGFPSGAVTTLLRRLVGLSATKLWHWGDIDPGGLRIARHLETSLGKSVTPHLMSIELASLHGRKPDPGQLAPRIPEESAFHGLAEFLRTDQGRWLEQEVIDPVAVE
jgi:hypothetical protein